MRRRSLDGGLWGFGNVGVLYSCLINLVLVIGRVRSNSGFKDVLG